MTNNFVLRRIYSFLALTVCYIWTALFIWHDIFTCIKFKYKTQLPEFAARTGLALSSTENWMAEPSQSHNWAASPGQLRASLGWLGSRAVKVPFTGRYRLFVVYAGWSWQGKPKYWRTLISCWIICSLAVKVPASEQHRVLIPYCQSCVEVLASGWHRFIAVFSDQLRH